MEERRRYYIDRARLARRAAYIAYKFPTETAKTIGMVAVGQLNTLSGDRLGEYFEGSHRSAFQTRSIDYTSNSLKNERFR